MQSSVTQEVLDEFYKLKFILMRERYYGKHYLSPGGEPATRELFLRLGLQPGEKVLDIGCGQGGPAMCMARYYGAYVHGLELCSNMVNLGDERLAVSESFVKQRVQLELADAVTTKLRKGHYDVIYSKDSIVHIKDKTKLYENCMSGVRPGGRLFITDWCRGDTQPSQAFTDYYNNGFNIETINSNVKHMEAAKFKEVKYEDLTKEMINNIEHSLKHFRATKQAFIKDYDAENYAAIVDRFCQYVEWAKAGELLWVLFTAEA